MPELLLELFSEEIPARMQGRAAEDLRRLVTEGLKAQGLEAGQAKAFATPRRIALAVHGVPAKQRDMREEKKGPRVGAPGVPLLGACEAGTWRGSLRFQRVGESAPVWAGAIELRDLRLAVDGLAEPLAVQYANFQVDGGRLVPDSLLMFVQKARRSFDDMIDGRGQMIVVGFLG